MSRQTTPPTRGNGQARPPATRGAAMPPTRGAAVPARGAVAAPPPSTGRVGRDLSGPLNPAGPGNGTAQRGVAAAPSRPVAPLGGVPAAKQAQRTRRTKEQIEKDRAAEEAAAATAQESAPEQPEEDAYPPENLSDPEGGGTPNDDAPADLEDDGLPDVEEPPAQPPKAAAPVRGQPQPVRPSGQPAKAPSTREQRATSGDVRGGHELAHAHQNKQLAQAQRPAQPAVQTVKSDLLVPRLLLMQGLSKPVAARRAFSGDIVRSGSFERVGGVRDDGNVDSIDIIPLAIKSSWTVMLGEGYGFVRSEPRTEANDDLPFEFEEDGESRKRYKTIDVIALVADDIRAAAGKVELDADGAPLSLDEAVLLPVAISFKSTGLNAGKNISTFFSRVAAAQESYPNTRPYNYVLELSCFQTANDDGEFFVFEIGGTKHISRLGEGPFIEQAKRWYGTLQKSNVVLQDEGQAEDAAEGGQAAPAEY